MIIIGYADQERLQKAMDKFFTLANDTVFQISTEKIKAILFSRKSTAIASRPSLDIWMKEVKIEQVRQHKIFGLIFDTRMNTNEHILSTKAEKINIFGCLDHTKWGSDQANLLRIRKMILLSTIRYGEEAYGSASKAVLKKLEPTQNR
jgi:hypothetical protein